MSISSDASSAAVLRNLTASIASDLAHAPLKSQNHANLISLTSRFLTMEKVMIQTSDNVANAIAHAHHLLSDARAWQSISEEGGSLRSAMHLSICRIEGPLSHHATVSDETAHP